jgi:hypothetical protein
LGFFARQSNFNTLPIALALSTNLEVAMSKPVYHAYSVREYEKDGKKESFWTKIGVVFEHKDGKGFDVVLEALPINGRVSIREPKKDAKEGEAGE